MILGEKAMAIRKLLARLLFLVPALAWAQNPCGDCRNEALAQHKACNAAAKDNAAFTACGKSMSDRMQACQVGACAKDIARIYEGYCAGCLQQAGNDAAKKKACEESVCRKAAGK